MALTMILALSLVPLPGDLRIAVDGDVAMPIGEGLDTAEVGLHLGGRIGYALPIPVPEVDVVVEVQATRLYFSSALVEEEGGWTGYGVGGGVRVGVLFGDLRPAIFAHAGYGDIEVHGSDYVSRDYGFVADAGAAVTWFVVPAVGVGLHVGYHTLIDAQRSNTSLPLTDDWIATGLHVELSL